MASNMRPVLEAGVVRRGAEITGRARERMESRLRRAAPVGQRVPGGRAPGTLQRSVEVSARRAATEYVLTARALADHAIYNVKGTAPHPIRPRRAGGLLVFFWPEVGSTVFFRHVNHPGTRPDSWWDDTLARFADVLRESQ
jgi:hypothetical protein